MPQTRLCTLSIPSLGDAAKLVGRRTAQGRIPLVLCPHRPAFQIWFQIPEGFYALMYKRGRYIGCREPGKEVHGPGWSVKYLVTKQYTVFDTPVRNCPTQDNVSVSIDTVLVFRITKPREFVLRLGAEKLDQLMRDAQSEAVRSLARRTKVEDIFDLSGMSTQDLIDSMNDKFSGFGVEVRNVTITSVEIPVELRKRMENIAWFAERETDRVQTHDFEKREENHKQELRTLQTELGASRESADKEAAILRVEAEKEIRLLTEEARTAVNQIEAETQQYDEHVKAETSKELAKLRAEMDAELEKIRANSNNKIKVLEAETANSVQNALVQAELKVAEYRAKIMEEEAEAEALISKMVAKSREHELELKRLDVLAVMVQNDKLMIQGDEGMISNFHSRPDAPPISGLVYERAMLDMVGSLGASMPSSTGITTAQIMAQTMKGVAGELKK